MALDIRRKEEGEGLDIREKGRNAAGEVISSDRRLFMQLYAFNSVHPREALVADLEAAGIQGALYEDLNDPQGWALLSCSDDPNYFISTVRQLFADGAAFSEAEIKPELTMFGRTYTIGYEDDLDHALIDRPLSRVLNPELAWVIWYPLRRSGQFEQLSGQEQRTILMEHGGIGRAYGKSDYAYDIRLACHGLDKHDNDFVIGVIGKELYPLSSVVQRMRKTKQTSLYLESLGPFFIGKVCWQSSL